jgi:hypothetical protein
VTASNAVAHCPILPDGKAARRRRGLSNSIFAPALLSNGHRCARARCPRTSTPSSLSSGTCVKIIRKSNGPRFTSRCCSVRDASPSSVCEMDFHRQPTPTPTTTDQSRPAILWAVEPAGARRDRSGSVAGHAPIPLTPSSIRKRQAALSDFAADRLACWRTQRWFRRGQRWRVGCEGRISVLKRRHGLPRCRDHGADGTHRWVGLGVIANNLVSVRRRPRRAVFQAAGTGGAEGLRPFLDGAAAHAAAALGRVWYVQPASSTAWQAGTHSG